jgi:hypothetical protein
MAVGQGNHTNHPQLKFNHDTCELILSKLRAGNRLEAAAEAAGVDRKRIYEWCKKGEELAEDEPDNEYAVFAAAVRQVRAQAEDMYVTLHAQNATGFERISEETIQEIAYEEESWQDEKGRWHKKRTPVVVTKVRKTVSTDRDTKAPMEWLGRTREGWSKKEQHSITGFDGGSIKFEETPSAALLATLNNRIKTGMRAVAARLVDDEGARMQMQQFLLEAPADGETEIPAINVTGQEDVIIDAQIVTES